MLTNEALQNGLPYLEYAHGFFNSIVILLFFYQGWLGLQIRNRRKAGNPPEVKFVRRHRKLGPSLAVLAIFGFGGGIATVYLGGEEFFEHPVHFMNGLIIIILIIITFFVSGKIQGRDVGIRNVHYLIGLAILALYFFQAYLGIKMIF